MATESTVFSPGETRPTQPAGSGAEPAPVAPRQRAEAALLGLGLLCVLVLGVAVRLGFVLANDFPLNDGGLFYVMVRDLQRAQFSLPVTTTYNQADLPYVYPPLAFYVAGLVANVGPWSLLDLFRWLPLLYSILTIPAFYLFSRAVLPTQLGATLATGAFALLPISFQWPIMGGGLTRGLGLLFALLALREAWLLYARPGQRRVLLTSVFSALTVLSHPAMAWLVAYSSAVFFLARGRTRGAMRDSLLVALGTIALTAPWWAAVIRQHGVLPILGTGSSVWGVFAPLHFFTLTMTDEPFFPVLEACAIVGAFVALRCKQWWLPLWVGLMVLVDSRSPITTAAVPIPLLAGIGISSMLTYSPRGSGAPSTAGAPPRRRVSTIALIVGGWALFLASLNAVADRDGGLVGVTRDQRDTMQWVAEQTPPNSRFLVITAHWYPGRDRIAEWFPALTERVSVITIQGYEWAPGGIFEDRFVRYRPAQRCAYRGTDCLRDWAREYRAPFDYVLLPKGPTGATTNAALVDDCCWALRAAVGADPAYEMAHDGPGGTVYRRVASPPRGG
jgi:hypothetical protein